MNNLKAESPAIESKICPRCTREFKCDADNDCWCESVQIHKKDMIRLMNEFKDCLCPECIAEYSEK